MPTCCSSDESTEVPHAVAAADAPLQQPLISALQVQELCCGTENTSGDACQVPENSPAPTLKEAAGERPANHPELGVSDRLCGLQG